jgi:hypothetical protein
MSDPPYTTYDIKHKVVRADTCALLHRNTPHATGDRYCIVLFNRQMNYVGSALDVRSLDIASRPAVKTGYTVCFDTPQVDAARSHLLDILSTTSFPPDRCTASNGTAKSHSKYGDTKGMFISFGATASRKSRLQRALLGMDTRESANRNNDKYNVLYNAFVSYMDVFQPKSFATDGTGVYQCAIIARNSLCQWHMDSGNIGHASLTALGDYQTGGELLVEDTFPKPLHHTTVPTPSQTRDGQPQTAVDAPVAPLF